MKQLPNAQGENFFDLSLRTWSALSVESDVEV
jgi:hypothetical protein